jgi:hypothetical protein
MVHGEVALIVITERTTMSTAEKYVQPTIRHVETKGMLFWKKEIYRLVDDFCFEWGPAFMRKRVSLKAGFEFDLASTTLLFALLGITPNGKHEGPSALHDRQRRDKGQWTPGEFEFETMVNGQWETDSSRWSDGEVDEFFRFGCICAGMPKAVAWLEWGAIRAYPINWFKTF